MQLVSVQFLVFTLATLIVYHLLARKAQNIWLLAASYFFYITLDWRYALVLLAVTLFNYLVGRKAASRAWLTFGILVDLSSFAALKILSGPYGPRFIPLSADILHLLLPVGFSFYILQAVSYLVDVHNKTAEPAGDLVDFALTLAYFPKLLAGPIERPARFLPQLLKDRHVDGTLLARGIGLILLGLIRKVALADRLSSFIPGTIFSDPTAFSSLEKLLWLLVFVFSLYNDFAGYTSIVRGISTLLGIELSPNFRQPFFAVSLSDFWTRWHISLSFWLRDYIFFPLRRWLVRKNFSSWLALSLPPVITMLASGFWHGAYASVMVWGGLHGLYLILEQPFRSSQKTSRVGNVFAAVIVFFITTLTLIPFAASSLGSALEYFRGLFDLTTEISSVIPGLDLGAAFLLTLWMDWQEARHGMDAFFLKWRPSVQAWGLAAAIWILILFLSPQMGIVTFVYQGF